MINGIICLETGEFEPRRTTDEFYALPLLQFMEKALGIHFIYRHVATIEELEYYIRKIGEQRFKNKFDVIYFSCHGSRGSIYLGGKSINLDQLRDMAEPFKSFQSRHIHFGSCETLDEDEQIIKTFKRQVEAASVSGYTREDDSIQAYINELAYFHQLFLWKGISTVRNHMEDYQHQLDNLGFEIV